MLDERDADDMDLLGCESSDIKLVVAVVAKKFRLTFFNQYIVIYQIFIKRFLLSESIDFCLQL